MITKRHWASSSSRAVDPEIDVALARQIALEPTGMFLGPGVLQPRDGGGRHARIERRLAEPTHVVARDLLEIQALPHQPNDQPRDVVLGHEVLHTRRQKQRLIDIPGAKVLAHSPRLNQTRADLNSHYSDGLLGIKFAKDVEAVAELEELFWKPNAKRRKWRTVGEDTALQDSVIGRIRA
jgi:hypothetical protein